MTDEELLRVKAAAFDLIASGEVTGMPTFLGRWEDMKELCRTRGDAAVLGAMAKLAAAEAFTIVAEERKEKDD